MKTVCQEFRLSSNYRLHGVGFKAFCFHIFLHTNYILVTVQVLAMQHLFLIIICVWRTLCVIIAPYVMRLVFKLPWLFEEVIFLFYFYNTDISILFSVVFIWFTKRNYCNEMWTHYAWWMLLRDDKARQVSSLELFLLFFSSDLRVKSWFLIDLITLTRFCCPICSKSIIDMSKTWKRIDEEVS